MEAGAKRVVPLNVSGAWHSALMEPAVAQFAAAIEKTAFQKPQITVISNVDAQPYESVDQIKRNLVRSIVDEVRWHDAAVKLLETGCDLVVEFGANPVLGPLIRRLPDAPAVFNVSDAASVEKLRTKIGRARQRMKFKGNVALITGASRGIGRAIAVDLARDGADVALVGRDMGALEETAIACRDARSETNALVLTADVADQSAVEDAVGKTVKQFGRLDFAISNAGQTLDTLLLRLQSEALDQHFAVNLKSAFYLCAAVARPMMKARSGSIVLMSSIVGLSGNAGQSAYAASKAGLLGLTKSLAKELGSRNIRVNAVAPGFIETAMTQKVPEAAKESLLKSTALGRAGKPEDVSGVVSFLCSQAAGYMTGQTLVVDGGILM